MVWGTNLPALPMRTKLFLSFIFIIALALLSNIIFEKLIINDFKEYVESTKEDRKYWLLATVEGSYREDHWDMPLLEEAIHWGIMLGFETYITTPDERVLIRSSDVLGKLPPSMLRRMSALFDLPRGEGEFSWYPLYAGGKEIGTLHIRSLKRLGYIPEKELIFLKRGKQFLLISFMIAGVGALFLSILFTIFLSAPLRRLTVAAEKVAGGNLAWELPPSTGGVFNKIFPSLKDEIQKLTETFNYMVEALRREDALRKHLTSNIAHELRTPLTIIKGTIEAIEDGVVKDREKALQNISTEIERIISLVEGIEDITRAEASFFKKKESEALNLKEFIVSVAEGMRHLFDEKGLYLRLHGEDMSVITDPEKLHIIVKNILTNAYKYTHSGGVEIRWGRGEVTNNFFIEITDTGRGISEEEISRIFDRFYKGEHSRGRGLGLSIVKELTEILGGRIGVNSTPGKGTTFRLDF